MEYLRAHLQRQGDCGPLGEHRQGDTGMASKSGHGTSRSSSRGRGGGRSWRGVVEVTDDLGPIQAPYVPEEVVRVTIWLLPWVVVNQVKSLWES